MKIGQSIARNAIMPKARKTQVSIEATPYYHCVSSFVRRAFYAVKISIWTGRILREDKKGAIPANTPGILRRLNIDSKHWVSLAQDFEPGFRS